MDFLAAVASYPKPDDKTRSTSAKVTRCTLSSNGHLCFLVLELL